MTNDNRDAIQTAPMPVIFVGHGSPMNAIEDNQWSQAYARLRDLVPPPSAILAISAHWYTHGSYVTDDAQPETIHDFYGFPDALYQITYPAPGDRELAKQIQKTLGESRVKASSDWGLDHGIWTVLHWMYPQAEIPVLQLSIDRSLNARQHYELGRSLAELRRQGVLILASGNIVHNLQDAFTQMRQGTNHTPDWARWFDEETASAIRHHDLDQLLEIVETPQGKLAHPTSEHWLPLLYAMGAAYDSQQISFPIEGFDLGSISMRSVLFS